MQIKRKKSIIILVLAFYGFFLMIANKHMSLGIEYKEDNKIIFADDEPVVDLDKGMNEVIRSFTDGNDKKLSTNSIINHNSNSICINQISLNSISSTEWLLSDNNFINLSDDNLNTNWSTRSKASYLLIDVGSVVNLCGINIGFTRRSGTISFVLIQTSVDGITYGRPIFFQNSGLSPSWESILF